MASDERKIVIELKAIGADDDEDGSDEEEESTSKARKATIKRAIKQVASFAYHEISTQMFYEVGKYTNLTEDYKTAVLIDNVQATIGKVKSLASSTLSSAMLGAKVGGLLGGAGAGAGAVVGAVVGAGMSITTAALELRRQYDQQNLQLAMGDRTAAYARSRLGLIDNGRGTYN